MIGFESSIPTLDLQEQNRYAALVKILLGDQSCCGSLNFVQHQNVSAFFLDQTHKHRIGPLVYNALSQSPYWFSWPDDIRKSLTASARSQSIQDLLNQRNLLLVATALNKNNIPFVLLKGAALSLGYYPLPELRPRGDTDLIIPSACSQIAREVMSSLGFRIENWIPGETTHHQWVAVCQESLRIFHHYDFHLKIFNPDLFSDFLTFSELQQEAMDFDLLGCPVKLIGRTHALLHACVHRIAHHDQSDHLLWIYDIHLLANRQSTKSLQLFWKLAEEKSVRQICLSGLRSAQESFGTQLPDFLIELLHSDLSIKEPSAAYLKGDLTLLNRLWIDICHASSWQYRWQILKEHLFPPRCYMFYKYGIESQKENFLLLAFLYIYRMLRGFKKLFHSSHF